MNRSTNDKDQVVFEYAPTAYRSALYVIIAVLSFVILAQVFANYKLGGLAAIRGDLWLIGVALVFIAVNVSADMEHRKILRPVAVHRDRVVVKMPDNTFLPIYWNEVKRVEPIGYPDADFALLYYRHKGIRIVTNTHRILIYDHIEGYAQLRQMLSEKLRHCWIEER